MMEEKAYIIIENILLLSLLLGIQMGNGIFEERVGTWEKTSEEQNPLEYNSHN